MPEHELEIPRTLPVGNLSVSSITTFVRCPERWRRRYIEREYEPTSGAMLLGSAVGAAEGHAYQLQVGEEPRPSTEDVLELYADEFDLRADREEVDWAGAKAGEVKDVGVQAVKAYETAIVPSVTPVAVEREFQIDFDGVEWGMTGYLDLEDDTGGVCDLKVRKSKLSLADAAVDIQPTTYLLARRAEGNPARGFDFHTMVKTKTPYAEVVTTSRSDRQLDALVARVYRIAAEIQWRLETDNWAGAPPGGWWCSQRMCGYWASCAMGGAA
jgi:RecB family exonuclease